MFKNTNKVTVFETIEDGCIVVRDNSEEITKEYLKELYNFSMINGLYLLDVQEPIISGVKKELNNNWVFEFVKEQCINENLANGFFLFFHLMPKQFQQNSLGYIEWLEIK